MALVKGLLKIFSKNIVRIYERRCEKTIFMPFKKQIVGALKTGKLVFVAIVCMSYSCAPVGLLTQPITFQMCFLRDNVNRLKIKLTSFTFFEYLQPNF